jgi:5'-methylthioadenosine phosphorylase
MANVALSQRIVGEAMALISDDLPSAAHTALSGAIMTNPQLIPAEAKERLRVIAGKYLFRD